MAVGVPPPPLNSPSGSYYWLEWYTNLTNFLNGTNIPWSNLNFSGSNLHDIVTRNHNTLLNVQGGNADGTAGGGGNAWHMTGRGYITSAGAGTGFPSGWTASRTGTGTYVVVHSLGLAAPNLSAIATSNSTGVLVQWIDTTSTSQITIHTTNAAGTATDANVSVIVMT